MKKKPERMYPPEKLTALAISGLRHACFFAALELDVYGKIQGKTVSIPRFSVLLGIPETSARALAQNLSNMGLLKFVNGRISNTELSGEYLTDDVVTKQLMSWLAYDSDPAALIRMLRDPPPQPWYAIRERKHRLFETINNRRIDDSFYIQPHDLRIRWGRELAGKYDFSKHRRLLDVGGACGGWSVGILEKNKQLEAVIAERKDVVSFTRTMVETHDHLMDRINVVACDFFRDSLPKHCDVVLLANVLHDWAPKECVVILKNIISSMDPGSTILVNEFYFDNSWKRSDYGSLQAMLVLGPNGKSGWQPSYNEMEYLLSSVGLVHIRKRANLIIAQKRAYE